MDFQADQDKIELAKEDLIEAGRTMLSAGKEMKAFLSFLFLAILSAIIKNPVDQWLEEYFSYRPVPSLSHHSLLSYGFIILSAFLAAIFLIAGRIHYNKAVSLNRRGNMSLETLEKQYDDYMSDTIDRLFKTKLVPFTKEYLSKGIVLAFQFERNEQYFALGGVSANIPIEDDYKTICIFAKETETRKRRSSRQRPDPDDIVDAMKKEGLTKIYFASEDFRNLYSVYASDQVRGQAYMSPARQIKYMKLHPFIINADNSEMRVSSGWNQYGGYISWYATEPWAIADIHADFKIHDIEYYLEGMQRLEERANLLMKSNFQNFSHFKEEIEGR